MSREEMAQRYRERIEEYLREQADPDLDRAIEKTREFFRPFGPVDEGLIAEVREDIERQLWENIRRIRDPYILSKARRSWYDESKHVGIHWRALVGYLEREKGWSAHVISSLSKSSARVVAELGDPSESEFDVRGLVVGHVQSGKTANMTAVIARAVDAGYNFVVVLAGTTDKLRHQTQVRLEEDLLARCPYNWHRLTSRNRYGDEGRMIGSGDYSGQPARQLPKIEADQAMIAVMKKHPAQLRRLLQDMRNSFGPVRNRWRLLVIDDEADLASPNAGKTDEDPTITNRLIRELLRELPTVSYVGYTATPFANILINPFPTGVAGDDEGCLEDLYPRDFIIALPRPDGYFGTEDIFGRAPANAEDEGADGMDVVRDVGPDEARLLSASGTGASLDRAPGLRNAIRWFVLAVGARLARGQGAQHASMLVHTSHKIDDHSQVQKMVESEIEMLRKRIGEPPLTKELRELWEAEAARVDPAAFGNRPLTFDAIRRHLREALDRLRVAVENSQSEERLSYEGEATAVIAIGGNILSRGLTLEGLTVSYFARRPVQYDTLLQMGRWFGYREGYEDLVRLWMPKGVSNAYRQLALVEHELREEIEEYAERKARPIDFAVRIRTLPGLQVTARNKMRHARTASIDYRGMHLQTIRFPRLDSKTLRHNWDAGSRLVARAGIRGAKNIGVVDVHAVLAFFSDYIVHPSHRELSSEWLERYIRENSSILGEWTVGVVGPSNPDAPAAGRRLGEIRPRLVRRARLRGTEDDVADIKALMSRSDILFDVPEEKRPAEPGWAGWEWARLKKWRENAVGQRPLLLLYPIDRRSEPRSSGGARVALDAAEDVLGIGIVFPQHGVDAGRSPTRYIQVNLDQTCFADEDND